MDTMKIDMLKRDALVMANARRLVNSRHMPNWELAKEIFGTGSITGYRTCERLGIDPDSYDTSFSAMHDHLKPNNL